MTSRWDDVDFTHTPTADTNRIAKARTLADWCWQHAIPPDDVQAWTHQVRNRVARLVGVNPPNRLSPTWDLTARLLQQMAAWADQHPWDDRAWQRLTDQRPTWTHPDDGMTESIPHDQEADRP